MENKLFYCLISISIFLTLISIGTASEGSDKLGELYTLINNSENIPKIYYLEQVPELNNYWSVFYSNISYSKNIYEDLKDKEHLIPSEINTINSLIYNLEENIDLIEILIDLEKAFTNRQASKNSNKGFEITINDQSITTNGANRLRAEYNREKSTVYLLMSKHLQGQSFWSGTSGLGLKTALMNIMASNYCFQIKSSGEIIDLYYPNGTHKTNSRIESDAQDLALVWAEDNPFSKYSKLIGEPKTFTIIIRTQKGNLYERNFIFNFIDSGVQNFETGYSYCFMDGATVKCNEVQYFDSDNNLINFEKVKYGESAKALKIPEEVEGYTFKEWNTSLENIINDIITIPLYEKHKFKVIFRDNKSKIIEEQYVFYNEDAILPTNPETKGYKFMGWDKNTKNIKNNFTFYPLYEEDAYFYNISDNLSENVTILVEDGTYFPKINVSSLIDNTTGQGTIPKITINVSNDYNMIIEIPLTNVTSSNLSWDGIIGASILVNIAIPKLEGKLRTQSLAINIGFSDGNLFFSNAVRLIFPNESGKLIAYYSNGKFKEINTICDLNSQSWADSNLSEGKECYINSGSDLIVWTKHFTEFVTYTEVNDIPIQPISKSAGGNRAPSSSSSNNCDTSWYCTEWSSCTDGFKTRTCTYDKNKCYPTHSKPEEKLSCFENKEENKITLIAEKNNRNKINTGFALGAVIKNMNYIHYILLTNVFLTIIVSTLITLKVVKKKSNKPKALPQQINNISR